MARVFSSGIKRQKRKTCIGREKGREGSLREKEKARKREKGAKRGKER